MQPVGPGAKARRTHVRSWHNAKCRDARAASTAKLRSAKTRRSTVGSSAVNTRKKAIAERAPSPGRPRTAAKDELAYRFIPIG